MKTIKQIADELGISKQRVYRYIKQNHINEAHQTASLMWFDDVVVTLIKRHFFDDTVSSDVHHDAHQSASNDAVVDVLIDQIEMLKKQTEIKDKQIETLMNQMENMQVLLKQEQDNILKIESRKNPFFKRILKR